MHRWGKPEGQSGQAILIGVMALLVLMISFATSMNYIGAKSTLGRKQAGPAQLNTVKAALHTFVGRNFRLPCPADGSLSPSGVNYGIEQTSATASTCTVTGSNGVIPWKTLGLAYQDAVDGYGTMIGYAASPMLAAPLNIPNAQRSFLTTKGKVLDRSNAVAVESCSAACGAPTPYAYVIISFGADRAGGYTQQGTRYSQPGSSAREFADTQAAAFSGGDAFQIWPNNVQASAGTSYYDHVLVYETASQLVKDLNDDNNDDNGKDTANADGGSNAIYGNPNSNQNRPSQAKQNSAASALAAAGVTSVISNSYSCTASSGFCPGATNAGSLSNTYGFAGSGCGGGASNCADSAGGECLLLVGNLGEACVHDPVTNEGIYVGNQQLNGDWIGPDNSNSLTPACSACYANSTPNYTIPTQTIIFNLTNSYSSFAFVDYLVDGGMQVQVDAYQSQTYPFSGTVSQNSKTITNIPSTSGLQIGQTVVNTTYFPDFTYITAVGGNSVTVSNFPSNIAGSVTSVSLTGLQNSLHFKGTLTAGSNTITSVSAVTNNLAAAVGIGAVGIDWSVSGPGIPAGTIVTVQPSAGDTSVAMSQGAIANETSVDLMFTPWINVGTRILSNSYVSNIANATVISGISSAGQSTITNVSSPSGLAPGQLIAGSGIQPGTIVTAVNASFANSTLTTTLSLSMPAIASNTGYFYLTPSESLITSPVTGTLNNSTTVSAVSSTTGIVPGQAISGLGIFQGTVVAGVDYVNSKITLSHAATASASNVELFVTTRQPVTGFTGEFATGTTAGATSTDPTTTTISNISNIAGSSTNTSGFAVGDYVESPNLQNGSYISAIDSVNNKLTVTNGATVSNGGTYTGAQYCTGASCSSATPDTPLFVLPLNPIANATGVVTSGSAQITSVSSTAGMLPGQPISATGLPSGTFIQSLDSATQITVSQAANSTAAGSTTLYFEKGTPVIGTTGTLASGNTSVQNVPVSSPLSNGSSIIPGEFLTNANLQDNTTVSSATTSGGTQTLALTQSAIGTETAAALTAGYSPPATTVTMTGTFSDGSGSIPATSITALSGTAWPGVGAAINGYNIPTGTMVSSIDNTGAVTMTQSASGVTGTTTASFHAEYPACPGPNSGGIYAATKDEHGTSVPAIAPITQHPSAAVAATIPSQIYGPPANDAQLQGNYTDQRDYQFGNLQFPDANGNPIHFNVLVFQVLPYIYPVGNSFDNKTYTYGMLFEGAGTCSGDINSGRCVMQGFDEWWNPPVVITSDCGQYPQ